VSNQLGDRIRRLRLAGNLTLREVGARAGVSATHLSEIERGRTSPTVGALMRIAAALGEEASRLVDDVQPPGVAVARAGERREWTENDATVQALTAASSGGELTVVTVALPPGAAMPRLAGAGEQFVLVLEGAVEILLPASSRALREGDAVHCMAEDCRGVRNRGETGARLLWACSPAATL